MLEAWLLLFVWALHNHNKASCATTHSSTRVMPSSLFITIIILVAFVLIDLACASRSSAKEYDFKVHVQPRSKLRAETLNAGGGTLSLAAAATSALQSQLCNSPFLLSDSSRLEWRRHLSVLIDHSWNSSETTGKLVSDTSSAMCCVLSSGSVWHQYAAARVIAAMGTASVSSRRTVCRVIGVQCGREVGECACRL